MPIDMDNMLPGFSDQLMCSSTMRINPNDGVLSYNIAAAPLRDVEILDVGFMVGISCSAEYKVKIGSHLWSTGDTRAGTATLEHFVAEFTIPAETRVGTVYRVSDGTLSWHTSADTEAERRLKKTSTVTLTVSVDPGADGELIPFVIMRGAEPLDPIA